MIFKLVSVFKTILNTKIPNSITTLSIILSFPKLNRHGERLT